MGRLRHSLAADKNLLRSSTVINSICFVECVLPIGARNRTPGRWTRCSLALPAVVNLCATALDCLARAPAPKPPRSARDHSLGAHAARASAPSTRASVVSPELTCSRPMLARAHSLVARFARAPVLAPRSRPCSARARCLRRAARAPALMPRFARACCLGRAARALRSRLGSPKPALMLYLARPPPFLWHPTSLPLRPRQYAKEPLLFCIINLPCLVVYRSLQPSPFCFNQTPNLL